MRVCMYVLISFICTLFYYLSYVMSKHLYVCMYVCMIAVCAGSSEVGELVKGAAAICPGGILHQAAVRRPAAAREEAPGRSQNTSPYIHTYSHI